MIALVFPRACPGVKGKPCLCLLLPLSENSSRSSSQAHLTLSGFSLKAPAQKAPFSVPHWLLPHYLFYCPHSIIVIWRSRTCLCFCFVGLPSLEYKLLKGTVRWTFFLKLPLLHPGPGPEETHSCIFKEGDSFKEQEMMPSTPPNLRHLPHSPGHGLGSSTPTSSPASAPLPEVPGLTSQSLTVNLLSRSASNPRWCWPRRAQPLARPSNTAATSLWLIHRTRWVGKRWAGEGGHFAVWKPPSFFRKPPAFFRKQLPSSSSPGRRPLQTRE